MNVCLVSREYPPHVGGGIGTYTVACARALASTGHRAVVVTVSRDGREHREEEDGVAVVRLPFLDGDDWSAPHPVIRTPEAMAAFRAFHPVSVFAMQVAAALPRLVEEFAIDVVEAPECGALAWFALGARRTGRWGSAFGAPERRGGRAPVFITHLHSPTAWIEAWNGPEPGRGIAELRRMEEESVRWSDGLVCPSRALASWAAGHWGLEEGAIEVIPYPLGPLEAAAREAAAGERRGGAAGRTGLCRVLFAGRLEPRKGVDTLLAAFARALEGGADLELDLAGRDVAVAGAERGFGAACLERLPEAARRRVRVHGQLGRGALARLRAQAPVAVVPSPMDNYPYTALEALAHGQVLVAARAGGVAELVRDGEDGVLFEPGDVEACAAALVRAAAAAREGDGLGRAGAQRVLEACGNEAVGRRRMEHAERLIARGSRAGAGARPAIVVIDRHHAPEVVVRELSEALSEAAAGGGPGAPAFAHGWVRVRTGRGAPVLAFGTPRLETLAGAPAALGPLVVRRDVFEAAGLGRLVAASPPPGPGASFEAYTGDEWLAALLLCAQGHAGMVVPGVVAEVRGAASNGDGWRRRALAAEAELAQIQSSRGWRLLERVRGVVRAARRWGRPAGTGPDL